MTITPIPNGTILTSEHAEFYEAARAFVRASFTNRKAIVSARREMEQAYFEMKRSEREQDTQERAA